MKKTVLYEMSDAALGAKEISEAALIIRRGGLVIFPTETVYGIAVNLNSKKALSALYRIKKRSKDKPLTYHIASKAMIKKCGGMITSDAKRLIAKFWPGPLTVLLPSREKGKIGFRMPDNRIALSIIRSSGVPVGAPSANVSGRRAPVDVDEIDRYFYGRVDAIIDGGRTAKGRESTIVDCTVNPPVIVREGAIKRSVINKSLKVVSG